MKSHLTIFVFDNKVGEDQAVAVEVGLVPVENQTVEVRVVLGLEVRRLIPIRSHLIPNNNILTRVVKGMYLKNLCNCVLFKF